MTVNERRTCLKIPEKVLTEDQWGVRAGMSSIGGYFFLRGIL